MLVQFSSDSLNTFFWSVSNWGPGAEAPWIHTGDLKGGLKSQTEGNHYMADSTNSRQVDVKTRGGYTFYTEFSADAKVTPPPKLLAELGVRTHDLLRDVEPATPETNARCQACLEMQDGVSDLSRFAMEALVNDNLPEAIRLRQDLIEMSTQIRTLHESTQAAPWQHPAPSQSSRPQPALPRAWRTSCAPRPRRPPGSSMRRTP
jgi:hypothetical protein